MILWENCDKEYEMYLSRIKLDTHKRNTQIALSAVNHFHGAVEHALPQDRNRKLWRLDHLGGADYLLILSHDQPDLSSMQKQFGFLDSLGETKNYSPLLERVKKDTRWHFRLVANPTHSEKPKDKNTRGKKYAHISDFFLYQWLERQGVKYGFTYNQSEVQITQKKWYGFRKHGQNPPVRFRAITYEGILQVVDENKMKEALIQGIGREKAYGMGLLTLMSLS